MFLIQGAFDQNHCVKLVTTKPDLWRFLPGRNGMSSGQALNTSRHLGERVRRFKGVANKRIHYVYRLKNDALEVVPVDSEAFSYPHHRSRQKPFYRFSFR